MKRDINPAADPKHESGQAWVHQVRRMSGSGSAYALKMLKNPSRRDRFKREVNAMDRLRKDFTVAVPEIVEADLDAYRPWFVMPWYEGGSLEAAVEDGRYRSDVLSGLRVIEQVATVLSEIHAAQMAHRDVKPANVLYDADRLLLTDFGLCLELDERDERLTATKEAVGSRYYIAPENEGGLNDSQDQRPADLYAFGKTMWAVLTGQQPPPREHAADPQFLIARSFDDPRLTPLDSLVRDLLNQDPRARLTDWNAIIDDLRTVEQALLGQTTQTLGLVSNSAVEIARRLRRSPAVEASQSKREEQKRNEEWFRRLTQAMYQKARDFELAVGPVVQELGAVLNIGVTTGGVPRDEVLKSPLVHELVPDGGRPVDHDSAIVFLIHSPMAVPAFPTLMVRMWLVIVDNDLILVRVPLVIRHNEMEALAEFLVPHLTARFGPFPLYRQATIDEAVQAAEETNRRFVSLASHYLAILDENRDPGQAEAWRGRIIEPAPFAEGAADA